MTLRVGELIARSASAEETKRDIESGFASGKFASPQRAGTAYMLRGDLQFALPSVYAGYAGGMRTGYIIVLAAPNAGHSH